MKKKIFIGIFVVVFILLLNFIYFVATAGMHSNNPPSLGEKISLAFEHLFWLSPMYTIIISVSNPIFTLFLIALIVILYYLYDNFMRNKKDIKIDAPIESTGIIENQDQSQVYDENSKIEFFSNSSTQAKSSNRVFKKVVLWGTLAIAVWAAFVFSVSSGPGDGMIGLMLFMPVMPIIYIFYPVYFVILSIRYSREKSSMDPLDKIMFYILAVPIISLGMLAVYKVCSGNIIQGLLDSRKQDIKKRSIQIDLVAKDISFDIIGLKVKYCNDSENSPNFYTKHFSIKVETDKKTEFTFPSVIYPPQSGKCEVGVLNLEQLGLSKGDVANITVYIDPENKVNETNKENNKLTKYVDLVEKQPLPVGFNQCSLDSSDPKKVAECFFDKEIKSFQFLRKYDSASMGSRSSDDPYIIFKDFSEDERNFYTNYRTKIPPYFIYEFCSPNIPDSISIEDILVNGDKASALMVETPNWSKGARVLFKKQDGKWKIIGVSCPNIK